MFFSGIFYGRSYGGAAVYKWNHKQASWSDLQKHYPAEENGLKTGFYPIKNGHEQALVDAVEFIQDNAGTPEHIVVTGYGPFQDVTKEGAKYGATTEDADLPFTNFDVVGTVKKYAEQGSRFEARVDLITDVSAMAIAEYWATLPPKALEPSGPSHVVGAFIIGEGVGGAFVQGYGEIIGQNHHTELGHMIINRVPGDPFTHTACRFHSDCVTSVASLDAMIGRASAFGIDPKTIFETTNTKPWEIEADYIAQMCTNTVMAFAPTRIVLGGHIMKERKDLLPMVQEAFEKRMGRFFRYEAVEAPEKFIGSIDQDMGALQGTILFGLQEWMKSQAGNTNGK